MAPKYEIMAGEINGSHVTDVTGFPRVGDTLTFDYNGCRVEGDVVTLHADLSLSVHWQTASVIIGYWGVIVCRRKD